jgi:hypothetical protein
MAEGLFYQYTERNHVSGDAAMTRKKPRPIPTDDELVRIFTGQKFKDMLAANWPGDKKDTTRVKPEDVEAFAKSTLSDARIYVHDVGKPEPKTTKERPLMSSRREATINFVMNLQMTFLTATGVHPSFTAQRQPRGPFANILYQCLQLLGAPIDDITFINKLQARSHAMTDEKGQPRRKKEPPPTPD